MFIWEGSVDQSTHVLYYIIILKDTLMIYAYMEKSKGKNNMPRMVKIHWKSFNYI